MMTEGGVDRNLVLISVRK